MTPAMVEHVTFVPGAGLRFFLTFHQPYCISVIKYATHKQDCVRRGEGVRHIFGLKYIIIIEG